MSDEFVQVTGELPEHSARAAYGSPDHPIQATHGSPDHPLKLSDFEIPCYVLADGRRVIIQQGLITALDMSRGGTSRKQMSGSRLIKFVNAKSISPFVTPELINALSNPIMIRLPTGGKAHGFEATVLADICEAVLESRKQKTLDKQQEHIAERCEILVRGFARVGIIALVDEATGYQNFRARNALEEILEKFISKELVKWTKMFPDEFYEELFRLRGWQYVPFSVKRPGIVGSLTTDIIYDRLAPGVVDELKRLTPRDSKGRRKHRFFQRLTEDIGHDKLREHMISVITLMKAATSWNGFYRMLQRVKPSYNALAQQQPLFDFEEDE